LFEHATGNTDAALTYVRHALELWKILYGPDHPDSITTINNAAVMLQSQKLYHESRIWFEASLAISEEVSGKTSINTATLLFHLSQALALDKDMRGAVNRMRESYNIFKTILGPENQNTKEAESWLEQLTQSAVLQAKQLQDLAKGRLRPVKIGSRGSLRPQPSVGQTVEAATTLPTTRAHRHAQSRGIIEVHRRRGFDKKEQETAFEPEEEDPEADSSRLMRPSCLGPASSQNIFHLTRHGFLRTARSLV